ncbi:hypothetical protein LUZ60_015777 [Juncus effusus]|nr:hypothetical protein LUZ60_015777 [Juncus effusus]
MTTASAGAVPPLAGLRRHRRIITVSSSLSSRQIKRPSSVFLEREPNKSNSTKTETVKSGRDEMGVLDRSEVTPRGVRDYIELSRELVKSDGGPVRFFSPIECSECADGSPLLFYLPGMDGVGTGLVRHHERLCKIFNVWCLHIPVHDRTPLEGLVTYIEKTIRSEQSRAKGRPVYVIGESIGACLALAVAARNPNLDLVLILANPATSFDKTWFRDISSLLLDVLPDRLHVPIPYFFSLLSGNYIKMTSNYKREELSVEEAIPVFSEGLSNLLPSLSFLGKILPKESLVWKLKLLKEASSYVNSRLNSVKCQTLILVSGNDEILPSREEAERLYSILPNCRTRLFKDSGHALLLEGGIDLVTIIKGACYYRRNSRTDIVSDYLPPTPYEFQNVAQEYKLITQTTDPVFLSTLPNGKVTRGLTAIPNTGPTILVGYHMLMGFELGPLVIQFLTEKNILLRGIAHPFLFERFSENLMPDSGAFDGVRIMGAVPVSGKNLYRLMERGEFVLLYPGGAREALHRKGEDYKLFWPEQSEFVRMASRFGATIIPFGAVGEDDICDILLDYDDLTKIPFYDVLNKSINEESVKLRGNYEGEIANQDLHPLILSPKIPGRFYFLFGKPIHTKGREKELKDREKAQQLYMDAKSEVENCISYLKEKREKDPYRSLLSRIIYKATHGSDSQIPTFDP